MAFLFDLLKGSTHLGCAMNSTGSAPGVAKQVKNAAQLKSSWELPPGIGSTKKG